MFATVSTEVKIENPMGQWTLVDWLKYFYAQNFNKTVVAEFCAFAGEGVKYRCAQSNNVIHMMVQAHYAQQIVRSEMEDEQDRAVREMQADIRASQYPF